MRKKILRVAAVMAFLAILSLYVPGLLSVEKATKEETRVNFRDFLMKPIEFLSNLLPFLSPSFGSGKSIIAPDQNSSTSSKIKITGGLYRPKNSDGD